MSITCIFGADLRHHSMGRVCSVMRSMIGKPCLSVERSNDALRTALGGEPRVGDGPDRSRKEIVKATRPSSNRRVNGKGPEKPEHKDLGL